MPTLVLIRHGESLWNRENRFTGWVDVDLSEKGVAEARAAGRLLKTSGYDFDIAFTSCLKRAIRTCWLMLDEMDQMWLPTETHWRLNERHYGALTGLNKDEIAARFGNDQVLVWRRSYSTPPEPLPGNDPANPASDRRYRDIPADEIPLTECLADTVERVVPHWNDAIAPAVRSGKRVLVVSHGNTLRALTKHLFDLSEDEIVAFNFPTGIPMLVKLDDDGKARSHEFLGDSDSISAAIEAVKRQGTCTPQA